MKQTQRKNNVSRELSLPTSKDNYFTIRELVKLNPGLLTSSNSDITIRVKLTKKIEDGVIAELGSLTGGKGRPQKAFALTPVTQAAYNKAKADNINLVDGAEKLINVISVSQPSTPATVTSPNTVTA